MSKLHRNHIPHHRITSLTDNHIYTKIITHTGNRYDPIDYPHSDDCYVFGLILAGEIRFNVDFKECIMHKCELHVIRPGQIHQFIDSKQVDGLILATGGEFMHDSHRLIFDKLSVMDLSVSASTPETEELKTLFHLISQMQERKADNNIIRDLTHAYIGLFAEKFKVAFDKSQHCSNRQLEILLRLNELIESNIEISHSPAYYAGKLHISTAHLNNVVNNITGSSTSKYIRHEIILRAKRLLYHTNLTVKEISTSLGIDDTAYFTRMFTKDTGESPQKFRQRFR